MTAIAINFKEFIQIHQNQVLTTSEFIATAFDKRHDNVLRKIDDLLREIPDKKFAEKNFKQVERKNKQTFGERTERAFELTKDGFMLLVMGFTGKAALGIKIGYIHAFNALTETVQRLAHPTPPTGATPDERMQSALDIFADCLDQERAQKAYRTELQVQKVEEIEEEYYPLLTQEQFSLLGRLVVYANSWHGVQDLLCKDPTNSRATELLQTLSYNYHLSYNKNSTGFLLVFQPDVYQDLQKANDWLHQQSAAFA